MEKEEDVRYNRHDVVDPQATIEACQRECAIWLNHLIEANDEIAEIDAHRADVEKTTKPTNRRASPFGRKPLPAFLSVESDGVIHVSQHDPRTRTWSTPLERRKFIIQVESAFDTTHTWAREALTHCRIMDRCRSRLQADVQYRQNKGLPLPADEFVVTQLSSTTGNSKTEISEEDLGPLTAKQRAAVLEDLQCRQIAVNVLTEKIRKRCNLVSAMIQAKMPRRRTEGELEDENSILAFRATLSKAKKEKGSLFDEMQSYAADAYETSWGQSLATHFLE
jgi:hypothetical protein